MGKPKPNCSAAGKLSAEIMKMMNNDQTINPGMVKTAALCVVGSIPARNQLICMICRLYRVWLLVDVSLNVGNTGCV